MVTAPLRRLEPISAQTVGRLVLAGQFPIPPRPVLELWRQARQRGPSPEEIAGLQWYAAWDGRVDRAPLGVIGYRTIYDFHSNSDIRAVIYLAGTPRSVVELVSHVCNEAKALGTRAACAVDTENFGLMTLLERLGYLATRIVYEDLT